jgi:hypothetical protein
VQFHPKYPSAARHINAAIFNSILQASWHATGDVKEPTIHIHQW